MRANGWEGDRLRDSPSLGRPFPVFFFRFRAWTFRQMIKDAPRWSSPRKKTNTSERCQGESSNHLEPTTPRGQIGDRPLEGATARSR
eukprot:1750547-Pyramimonas_sp.AAC.1